MDTQGRSWGMTLDFSLSSTILLFLPSFSSAGLFCVLLQEQQVSVAVAARRWGQSWCQSQGEGTWGGCLLFCWHLWVTENVQWENIQCPNANETQYNSHHLTVSSLHQVDAEPNQITSILQHIVSLYTLPIPDILLSSLNYGHISNYTQESLYRSWYL